MYDWSALLHKVCLCCAAMRRRDTATGRNMKRRFIERCLTERGRERERCLMQIMNIIIKPKNWNHTNRHIAQQLDVIQHAHQQTHTQSYESFLPPAKWNPWPPLFVTHTHTCCQHLSSMVLSSQWICLNLQLHVCAGDCRSVWVRQSPVWEKNSMTTFQVSYRSWSSECILFCSFFLSSFAVSLPFQMIHIPACFYPFCPPS